MIATGQSATLEVSTYFRDPDGGALTYTAASSAAGVVSVSLSGTTLTMVGVADGTATVTVTARDPDGLTAAQGFQVTVETPNRAPEAVGTIPNQTVATGRTVTLSVSSYFRDPDGDALTYTAASSAAAVISVSLSGSTLTMVGVADGTGTVTVTARDPDGLTAGQNFQVTVETPNRAPEAVGTIPNQSVDTGSSRSVDVTSYFRDPDGDALTYTAASSNAAVATAAVSGARVTISAVAAGTATVTVTARDPDGLTAAQGFRVTVETPNRAPQAVGTIPNQSVNAGSSRSVDVTSYFRDPDGDALTYTAASSNAGVATAAVSGARVTISAVAAGTATVTVTARDPGGLTAAQRFQVTVETPNRAPQAVGTIPNLTVTTGGTAPVDVSSYFRDPDGDALIYTATSSAPAVASVSVSGSTVTVTGVAAGSATVTVTARDPGGLTGTQRFGVTVRGGGGGSGFRDDFDSSASLGDWEVRNANAVVSNGILRLTNTTDDRLGIAEREVDPALTEWTIRARLGRATREGTVGLHWFTEDDRYRAFGVLLGPVGGHNYSFLFWDNDERAWFYIGDLSGTSDAVRDAPGEFTDLTIGLDGQEIYLTLGGTEIWKTRLRANLHNALANVTDIWLASAGDSGATHLFDWVEVTGEASGGGGGGGAPDLVVSVSPSNVTVAPGGSFSYDVTVRNDGDGSSAATQVRHFQSSNASITTNDREFGQANVPPLDPSGEASATITISVPAGATPGTTTYVGSCVDAVSGESDTGNNCSSAVTVSIESGGGGDACTVGLVLSPGESCTFSGGTFEVLSNGCVRVGSVSGICAQNIFINGLRATRLSGNRWEILALPSGDAGGGKNLTATSTVDLTESSTVTKTGFDLTGEAIEIRRKR